jgi:hypothetical protein
MQTNRFGVRPLVQANGGPRRFEIFDRCTGAAIATGMHRAEAERDARSRNGDTSGLRPTALARRETVESHQHSIG